VDIQWIPKTVLPTNFKEYYTYSGSLTHPPCDAVTWIVLKKTLKISVKQLEKFRELKDYLGEPTGNNFRPSQPLNNRIVEVSFNG